MRFSVIIPTHNRADLLRHSLASAMEQTFDDYEVIVSNNASTDHTEEVVAGFSHSRLKLVRTDSLMSMVDHWEFALHRASGDWVLLVCDDDALLPYGLSQLDRVIREADRADIIQFDRLRYVYGDGVRADGNYIELGKRISHGLHVVDSSKRLFNVYWRLSLDMPKLLNSVVSRSLLEKTRARFGSVFGPWAPDLAVGIKLLASTTSYLKTGPLMLWGENMQSYGSGARRDPAKVLEFLRQFPDFEGTFPYSPYPDLITVTNGIFDTYCRLREYLGDGFQHLQINPVRFRRELLKDIDHYVERGHDQFRAERERIARDLARLRRRQNLDLLELLRRVGHRAESLPEKLRRLTVGRKTTGWRTRHRFENIYEAAQFVGSLPEA